MGLINKSEIKRYSRVAKVRLGQETYSSIDLKVQEILTNAITRAKENGRNTIMSHDL